MNLPKPPEQQFDPEEWAKRKSANKRLGILFGVIVLLIFLGSIWKYRPL
ncbi:hypothetical protein [Rhodoferax sp.]|nr:hypothetical protein [Rhodoferax sp.]MDD2924413.1 hypothetical protein [Rhodoferax sp.]